MHAIEYVHLVDLGGRRSTTKESINTAWKNTSFRGYADYMQTDEFAASLRKLLEFALKKTTAIMCAEAVPWRCHRSLLADALLIRGLEVWDIIDKKNVKIHQLTAWAKVEGLTLTYPQDSLQEKLF